MTAITIGQLQIPIAWLAFFAAMLYSDIRTKGDASTGKHIERAVMYYVVSWKLSYIVVSWSDFVQAPLSLLYFDGGQVGHVLALLFVLLYLAKHRRDVQMDELLHYWARFAAVFLVVTQLLEQQWLFAAVAAVLLLITEKNHVPLALIAQLALFGAVQGFTASSTIVHIAAVAILLFKGGRQHIALVLIAVLVAVMVGDAEREIETTARPTLDLPTVDGAPYVREQPITVVNFFATWCPPCKAEMPHLQSFAENIPPGVELVGVNLTKRDDGLQALEQFLDEYDVTYPVLLDAEDAAGKGFDVMSIPTTVFLNADGEELERIVGPVSEQRLKRQLQRYIQ